jgi:hypothetical protein
MGTEKIHNEETKRTKTNEEETKNLSALSSSCRLRFLRSFVVNLLRSLRGFYFVFATPNPARNASSNVPSSFDNSQNIAPARPCSTT